MRRGGVNVGRLNRDPLAWGRYVAIAGAYAACYELTRYFSFSHWTLTAGLRLACLFLVPKRFWLALAVGEALPIAEMAALHARQFGITWAVLASIPPMLVCMPIVGLLRTRSSLRRPDGQINMAMLTFATLACALVTTLDNSLVLSTVVMADGSPTPSATAPIFLAWLLGAYLGALTITPTIMAIRERVVAMGRSAVTWQAWWRSPLTRDTLFIAAPVLALLLGVASQVDGGALQAARIAMAAPVLALTWRHGWHGSAIGGMLASIGMASTSFRLQDPAMIQAQTVLAFVLSTSLLFGVRVARRMSKHVASEHPMGAQHR